MITSGQHSLMAEPCSVAPVGEFHVDPLKGL